MRTTTYCFRFSYFGAPLNQLDFYAFFDRVFVVNLDKRKDRWNRFLADLPPTWPFGPPIRFPAVDGSKEDLPVNWQENAGAWGCFQSHVSILRQAIENKYNRILVLEDDALFCEDFSSRTIEFLCALPSSWELAYLGGQHIELHLGRPRKVSQFVYAPFNVNRTHAYAIQGSDSLKRIYDFLVDDRNWTTAHHVDHLLGAYQKKTKKGIYVPGQWFVAQDEGASDILHSMTELRAFFGAEDIANPKVLLPMVAVMGPISSGTSVIAGVLHRLGVSMGSSFETPDQSNQCGNYEAVELAKMCRQMFEEPWMTEKCDFAERESLLRVWAMMHTKSNLRKSSLVGGKHPFFCLMGNDLARAWNEPIIVSVERDENEICNSLLRRNRGWPLDACINSTRELIKSQQLFTSTYPRVIRIGYNDLVSNPRSVIAHLCSMLELSPSNDTFESVVSFIANQRQLNGIA